MGLNKHYRQLKDQNLGISQLWNDDVAGMINLSALPADLMLLIHPDLRVVEANAAILLHHGALPPQPTRWPTVEKLMKAVMLARNQQQNNLSFLERLGSTIFQPKLL